MPHSYAFTAGDREIELAIHDLTDPLSSEIVTQGYFHEREVLHYIGNNYPYNGTIIDVGATIGNFAVFAAHFINYQQIVCFEPQRDNFDLLLQNTEFCNTKCLPVALGEKTSMVGLQNGYPENYACFQTYEPTNPDLADTEMRTLDSYNFDDVSMLKIDVVGNEINVLLGALHTLRKHKPVVFIYCAVLPSIRNVLRLLAPLGYACTGAISNDFPVFEFKVV